MGTKLEQGYENTSHEITPRELRKLNIIIFNMTEGNSDDSKTRKQQDRDSFKQIYEEHFKTEPEGDVRRQRKTYTFLNTTEEIRTQLLSKAKLLTKSGNDIHRNVNTKRHVPFRENGFGEKP